MPCPFCSSAYLDPYGRCPACGYLGGPNPTGLYPVAYAAPTAPSGVSLATQVLTGISGLLALLGVAATTYGYTLSRKFLDGSGSYDQQRGGTAVIGVTVGLIDVFALATAVLFMIWLFKSAKLSAVLAPGQQTLGAGWAIGGWFIPLAFLVLPRLVVGGVWRAAEPLRDQPSPRRPHTFLVTAWWITFCIGQLGISAGVLSLSAPTVSENHDSGFITGMFVLALVVELMRAASAVLGVVMLRRITTRQQIRILQGPGAGHPYSAAMLGGYGQQPQPGYAPQPPYAPGYPQQQPQYPQGYAQPPQGYAQPYVPTQPSYPPQPAQAPAPVPVPVQVPVPVPTVSVPQPAPAPEDAVPTDAVPAAAAPEDSAPVVDLAKPAEPADKADAEA